MRLRSIYEDWDKALTAASELVGQVNIQLKRMPIRDAQSKLFMLANTLANSHATLGGLTPEESDTVFTLMGQKFGIEPTELRTAYDSRLQEVGGYSRDTEGYNSQYSPQDWLHNYARHQHMPTTGSPPQGVGGAPTSAPAPSGEMSPELMAKLAKAGIESTADLAKLSKIDLIKAGFSLADIKTLAGSAKIGSSKAESRIWVRPGDDHIDYKDILTEMLFGQEVVRGSTPFDRFLIGIEGLYIEFDPANPKFQALAQRIFRKGGKPWQPTPDQWIDLIMASSQQPELQERLAAIIVGTSTAQATADRGGGGKIIIQMKRGTMIEADHVVMVPPPAGSLAAYTGYILAGIGSGGPTCTTPSRCFCRHPDFSSYVMVPRPPDPHSTQYQVTYKFKKILSMMPANVARIMWPGGRVQNF